MSTEQASPDQPHLELRAVAKSYGAVQAVRGVSLSVAKGALLALLGPSGCGKTTTLRMVAGLEHPTGGEILVGGRVLANAATSVEPERRNLGMVFQSYALWPHMNVSENVAYGLRRQRRPAPEIAARVSEVLGLVGMADYADRPSTNLSGGQQQRVALARALATTPGILLFDEPLSNLDAVLRESMRFEIRNLQQQQGITAIYVTHSQEEALAMADVIGVMEGGRLHQVAAPELLYTRPVNRFVASFVGLANLLTARIESARGDEVVVDLNGRRLALSRGPQLSGVTFAAGGTASMAIRPESLKIAAMDAAPAEPRENRHSFEGVVRSVTFSGNLVDYFVHVPALGETLRVQEQPPRLAGQGDTIVLDVATDDCILLAD